ncbi:alanine--tRNA ligase [Phosphitispora fastidiosa]|uniref:alanine--tRNA ligase n=1 Tax=Phosphitispora fastidiosa TaxID=2837202 RepID=UPI001E2899C0|nr:alanine--tRNA ligase [Phosphitispora fastidiosa]MBU7007919.1 alanyl-tRNA synthetase [Phosphitispora fastidiosa]
MLTGNEVREKFLKYYESKGHMIVSSSSLVPHEDPTLLFTNAGMNQFKDVFLGLDKRPYKRATTSQKCVRAGGKHNDLDTVGRTARHHTFFEMLGNFSFGDYFKRDAISYAWEFLTETLGLPEEKLYPTIYTDDDEAFQLWQEVTGVPAEKIVRLGEKDNFWSMGDTGPCGPCSEIIYDRGEEFRCQEPECYIGKCDCDRWLEIWNLVFMQYNRDHTGKMTPLPKPSIDTGMGLERITSVIQGVASNYDTDLLKDIITEVEKMCGQKYSGDEKGFPFRVIADHARACTFLISDGVQPSNDGRGYVLRRILRRAVRFGKSLGIEKTFLHELVDTVIALMGAAYPEIAEKKEYVSQIIRLEEERFHETLHDGLKIVGEMVSRVKSAGELRIGGEDAFVLYDTYGFPLDLTEDIAEENGLEVDRTGFEKAMQQQRERARAARQDTAMLAGQELYADIAKKLGITEFNGYEQTAFRANVVGLIVDKEAVPQAEEGQKVEVILDKTPFYGESGGQVGDTGYLTKAGTVIRIYDTKKAFNGLYIHLGVIEKGILSFGDFVEARIDEERRTRIARNHSVTHLLHKAMKEILGEHVNQAGSLVEPDRLRFDFTHFQPVSAEELKKIEARVNQKIMSNLKITTEVSSIEEAKKAGATALFGEKYGDRVRVVRMGDYSMELCGGTHLKVTAEAGIFKVLSESGIGSGLRRIEAVTGDGIITYITEKEQLLEEVSAALKTTPNELARRAEGIVRELREKEKELEALQAKIAKYESLEIIDQVREINGIKALAAKVNAPDMDALRNMGDMMKDKLGSGVVVLGSINDGKVNLVAMATKDVLDKGVHAGNIIREVAKTAGGGGGGRPDMAQAGAKDPGKIAEALEKAYVVIESQVK